jgi:hypothetical protein
LRIPEGSSELIANVFEDVRRAEMGGTSYDSYVGWTRRLPRFKIADDFVEAGLVISMLEAGAGMTEAAVLVNENRVKQTPGPQMRTCGTDAARAAEWKTIRPDGAPSKNKPRARQRKETLMRTVPCHPDVEEARELIRKRGLVFVS